LWWFCNDVAVGKPDDPADGEGAAESIRDSECTEREATAAVTAAA